MNKLNQLQKYTTIVADTGDINSIKEFMPQDATTNPSLVLKAIQSGNFDGQLEALQASGLSQEEFLDHIAVEIGHQILGIVPGYVSTEVDARLSFDTEKTVEKAKYLIHLYEQKGWDKSRILIKMASTWEGIRAAEILEQQGITCNLTLLFGMSQARACADAGVTLISPFVGRILDWHKATTGQSYSSATDPGVLSVKAIYEFYKTHNFSTIVMGASFRNIGEIEELAGCDRLTIAPALLQELQSSDAAVPQKLFPSAESKAKPEAMSEQQFRLELNNDAMATEKLSEGIRNFIKDQEKLEELIKAKFF